MIIKSILSFILVFAMLNLRTPRRHFSKAPLRMDYTLIGNLFSADAPVALIFTTKDSFFPLQHSRLGHLSTSLVSRVLKNCNLPFSAVESICSAYCMGISQKLPFPTSTAVYNKPLKLVYIDGWALAPIPSINSAQYYNHFLNAYSKYTWIYLLHSKSQVYNVFLQFRKMVELQLGTKLKNPTL